VRSGAHDDPLTRQFPAFRSTGRIRNEKVNMRTNVSALIEKTLYIKKQNHHRGSIKV